MTQADLRRFLPLLLLPVLAACSSADNGVRVTAEKAAAPTPAAAVAQPRSEPIYYNGKTYKLDFAPVGGGTYDMKVSGMSASQQKDAVAVATSSLRYFACPDGKTGKLVKGPSYAEAKWVMSARCG